MKTDLVSLLARIFQRGSKRRIKVDTAPIRDLVMDRYRERLQIIGNVQWEAFQPLIQTVISAGRVVGAGGQGRVVRFRKRPALPRAVFSA